MKKEKTTVTLVHNGEEIDITKGFDEISKITKIIVEIKGQVDHLLETHSLSLYKALKSQANELSIGLAVKVKGLGPNYEVSTDITYVVEKVKDGLDAVVNFSQDNLFKEKE